MDVTNYYAAFYSDFFQYMKRKKIYVNERQRKNLGDTWVEMLHEFVGQLVTDKRKGSSINSIYDEMCSLFPVICSEETTNEDDQLIRVFEALRYTRKLRQQMKEEESRW